MHPVSSTRHTALSTVIRPLTAITLALGCLAANPVHALQVELPAETASYEGSDLPGFALAQRHCLTCHSAQYVSTQPGTMKRAFWDATVKKMRETYHADIPEADLPLIAEYLSHTYGADRGKPAASQLAAKTAPTSTAVASQPAGKIDIDKLMTENACTACHRVDKKVVGPAFQEVAKRYAGQKDAATQLIAHIRDGGSGRWGPVPMPPQPGLKPDELQALANWVLSQTKP
ncbi:MAG: c-type cytochrome [Lautropia sp.]|nr:c-type cytochrome [Lautropia sp.]